MLDPHNNGKAVASSAIATEIVKNFESLVRKSSRLFGSLRDLPQFGKYWSNHFQKTFEVYTKLWKYQQQHRAVLEDKEKYGLKRWEIGEIASKIGQLYYHYYLRTSDANYLQESLIFYEAIRARGYFKEVMDTKLPDLMVKAMRYYARYIVVCLLLARRRVVVELVDELTRHVEEYIKSLKPPDAHEWHVVLQEITSFLQADSIITLPPQPSLPSSSSSSAPSAPSSGSTKEEPYYPPPRLDPALRVLPAHTPYAAHTPQAIAQAQSQGILQAPPPITLQQVVLVGNHASQVKFSELTLEMFRMMLALELDTDTKAQDDQVERPSILAGEGEQTPGAPVAGPSGTTQQTPKKRNPHKHLLYRPTAAQLLMFAATVTKELYEGKALLLYLCGDGLGTPRSSTVPSSSTTTSSSSSSSSPSSTTLPSSDANPPEQPSSSAIYSADGLAMNAGRQDRSGSRSLSFTSSRPDLGGSGGVQLGGFLGQPTHSGDAIYPEDLRPFTRRPLFLIIDSDSSSTFKILQNNTFGQPLVSLLSPTLPVTLPKGLTQKGKFYTLFLYDPLSAICALTGATRQTPQTIQQLTQLLNSIVDIVLQLLMSKPSVDGSFISFLADDFLRIFMMRHVICCATMYLHRATRERGAGALPASQPDLGDDVTRNEQLLEAIQQLATVAGVADQFGV